MKKIICLSLILITFTSDIFSQYRHHRRKPTYFNAAFKIGLGNSILKSENIELDPDVKTTFFARSTSIGGRLGITFKDNFNISYEGLYYSFGQEFDTEDFSNLKTIRINSYDHLILFRYSGYSGTYVEFGPKLTRIKRVKETNSNTDLTFDDLSVDMFNQYYKSIVIGIGVAPVLKEKLSVTIGVRFNYGFDDLMTDNNQLIKDVVTLKDHVTDPILPLNDYPEYKTTKVINLQFMIEINYLFASFGDSRKPGFHLFK